jgi:hypothetical protein
MCNLLTGLGDIPVTSYRPDLAPYIKPMNYIGEQNLDLSVYKYGNGEYLLYLCKKKVEEFSQCKDIS